MNLDKEGSILPQSARHLIIPVIVSVIYPKLFSKKSLKHRSKVDNYKNVIFEFFSSLNDKKELQFLIDVIMINH